MNNIINRRQFTLWKDDMSLGITDAMTVMEAVRFAVGYIEHYLEGRFETYHYRPETGVLSIGYFKNKADRRYSFMELRSIS